MLNVTAITHEHVHVYTVYVSLVPSPSSAAVFWLHFCILQDIKDIYIYIMDKYVYETVSVW